MTAKATIFLGGSKYQARVLFDNNLVPVEVMRRTDEISEMRDFLENEYPGVDIVSQQTFQMELDHIKLFGCRWEAEDIVLQPLVEDDRLSYDDIVEVLNDADTELDRLDGNLNAILPSPAVDDDPI